MESWFFFCLIAFFLIGVQRFLYKAVANKGIDPDVVTFYFMIGVFVMASIWFFINPEPINNLLLLILLSLGNSLSFLTATVSHIRALRHIKASIAYPLIRLNIILVVLFSIFVLNEHIKISQSLGIATALLCMFLLAKEQGKEKRKESGKENPYKGVVFILIAMICGATSSITSKLAAEKVGLISFILVSYGIASICLFLTNHKKIYKNTKKDTLGLGFFMSVLNFGGFYFYLKSLKVGPLAIISSINGLHFIVAVVLSVLIYKEKVSITNLISILLAILSIVLLKGF